MVSDEYLDGSRLPQSLRSWKHRLAREANDALSLGAFVNEQMVALLVLEFEHDAELGTLLDTLHVHPDHRGRRIAEALIREAAIRTAKAHGNRPLHLTVFEVNTRARKVYDRLGGKVIGKRTGLGPDGNPVKECVYFWPALNSLAGSVVPQ